MTRIILIQKYVLVLLQLLLILLLYNKKYIYIHIPKKQNLFSNLVRQILSKLSIFLMS